MLVEIPIASLYGPFSRRCSEFIAAGLSRAKRIDCFDFVPSNYQVVHAVLAGLPRGRFCEWGSSMGVVTGLAADLGFAATGIELAPQMVAASRQLLSDFGITARILEGSYYDLDSPADCYFTYCWPGQMNRVEEQFEAVAPRGARLLICHGAEDVRCKVREAAGRQ